MPQEGRFAITLFNCERDAYSVSFAHDQHEHSGAGAVGYDLIYGLDALMTHLLGLNIHEDEIQKEFQDLQRDGRCYIPHVISDD